MKKILILSLIVLITGALIVLFVYTQIYNKPHQEIRNVKAEYILHTSALLDEFTNDEESANKKYLDKILQIKGKIRKIDTVSGVGVITLGDDERIESVICNIDPAENKMNLDLEVGQLIEVKGLCTGFLMDVMLVRAVIVN